MIVIVEPERAPGFVSGGYRYQHEVGARLAARGAGEVIAVAPAALAGTVARVRARAPQATIVADGLFACSAARPPGTIVLLHGVPERDDWRSAPIVATSARTAAALGEPAHAAIVRPGLDACFMPRTGARAPGPPRIVCVGTVGAGKNQLQLVNALADVRAPCELELLGDHTVNPDYVAAVRAAARDLVVHWRGVVTAADVASALQHADLFVSASRSESFGMAAAEAAACGAPVLALDTGEIATFVRDGDNGWLLPADAPDAELSRRMRELLRNPDRLAAARAAAVRPPLLDWDGVTNELERACALQKRTPA